MALLDSTLKHSITVLECFKPEENLFKIKNNFSLGGLLTNYVFRVVCGHKISIDFWRMSTYINLNEVILRVEKKMNGSYMLNTLKQISFQFCQESLKDIASLLKFSGSLPFLSC